MCRTSCVKIPKKSLNIFYARYCITFFIIKCKTFQFSKTFYKCKNRFLFPHHVWYVTSKDHCLVGEHSSNNLLLILLYLKGILIHFKNFQFLLNCFLIVAVTLQSNTQGWAGVVHKEEVWHEKRVIHWKVEYDNSSFAFFASIMSEFVFV